MNMNAFARTSDHNHHYREEKAVSEINVSLFDKQNPKEFLNQIQVLPFMKKKHLSSLWLLWAMNYVSAPVGCAIMGV